MRQQGTHRHALAWVLVLLALGGLGACQDEGERPAHHPLAIPGNTTIDSFEKPNAWRRRSTWGMSGISTVTAPTTRRPWT
jgi:hypothetical protein